MEQQDRPVLLEPMEQQDQLVLLGRPVQLEPMEPMPR